VDHVLVLTGKCTKSLTTTIIVVVWLALAVLLGNAIAITVNGLITELRVQCLMSTKAVLCLEAGVDHVLVLTGKCTKSLITTILVVVWLVLAVLLANAIAITVHGLITELRVGSMIIDGYENDVALKKDDVLLV